MIDVEIFLYSEADAGYRILNRVKMQHIPRIGEKITVSTTDGLMIYPVVDIHYSLDDQKVCSLYLSTGRAYAGWAESEF